MCHTGNSRGKRPNPAICLPGKGVKGGIELEDPAIHANPAFALEPAGILQFPKVPIQGPAAHLLAGEAI